MGMVPTVNTVAKFTFTSAFDSLDGVYLLQKTITFEAATATDVDFIAYLYTPAGIENPQAAYADDYPDYVDGLVMELVSQVDGSIIYAPEAILAGMPDPMVKRYDDIFIAIDVGPVPSGSEITWLIGELNDIAAKVTGTSSSAKIMVNSDKPQVWLTDAEYAEIVEDRDAIISEYKPLSVQLYELQQENARLRDKIAAYEEIIESTP